MRSANDELLLACLDVDYREAGAVAAGLWFRGWPATMVEAEVVVPLADIAAYEPGAFYRRELPCLLKVLEAGPRPDVILVDGYVWLGGKPGLGARLHDAVGGIVVGVAKTRFEGATEAVAVLRDEQGAAPRLGRGHDGTRRGGTCAGNAWRTSGADVAQARGSAGAGRVIHSAAMAKNLKSGGLARTSGIWARRVLMCSVSMCCSRAASDCQRS